MWVELAAILLCSLASSLSTIKTDRCKFCRAQKQGSSDLFSPMRLRPAWPELATCPVTQFHSAALPRASAMIRYLAGQR